MGTEERGNQRQRLAGTYFRLLQYARPYWPWILVVLLLSLLTAFLSILPAQVLGVAVNEITGFGSGAPRRGESGSGPVVPHGTVLPLAPYLLEAVQHASDTWLRAADPAVVMAAVLVCAFLVLSVVSKAVSILQESTMARVGQSLIHDMRSRMYAHVQRLSVRYFEDRQTGEVMSRVINDVNALERVIVGPAVALLTDLGRLGWVLYFCLSWDWRLTLLSLTSAPVILLSTWIVGRALRRNSLARQHKTGELNGLIQANISGIRLIKSFAREDYELGRFSEKSREASRISVRLADIFAVYRPWIDLLNQVGYVVVLGMGSVKVLRGGLDPGTFVVFLQYMPMLFGPITGVTRFYDQVQGALASGMRLFEVLDTEPEITVVPHPVLLADVEGDIRFDRVHFGYRADTEVLSDVTLHAAPGELIALVGASGAGKTTLVNLIARFYDPTGGAVLVDGVDIRQADVMSLRRQMAIVSQNPYLFFDTAIYNLRYGRLDATDEEVVEAAKAANAHDFIMRLADGYDTFIGEWGVKLSGGERQRLSIARAILADTPILILDEATSSVDSATERLIQEAVGKLVQNRTSCQRRWKNPHFVGLEFPSFGWCI